MTTAEQLGRQMQERVAEVAERLDYTGLEAKPLLSQLWWTFNEVDYLKREIFDWAAMAINDPIIKQNPQLLARCVYIAWQAEPIAIFILAVRHATMREINDRSSRNKTNLNFGLLKIGHDLKELEMQKKAWGHLRGILVAIPYKKNWFHPAEGKDAWLGVIDEALAELLRKVADLPPAATLERMTANGFAFVYGAVEDWLTDEVRRLARRPKEIRVGDINAAFGSVPSPIPSPEDQAQRRAVIKLTKTLSGGFGEGTRAVLGSVGKFLENVERLGDSCLEIRAQMVKDAARDRGVSVQQARRDVEAFRELVQVDDGIKQLREEIRALGLRGTGKIAVRFREVEGSQDDYPQEASVIESRGEEAVENEGEPVEK